MSVLWCGGEDVDFPNGGTGITIDTAGGHFRSYSRCGIRSTGGGANPNYSNAFPGGAVTSCWMMAIIVANSSNAGASSLHFGVVKQSTQKKGVWVGSSSNNSGNGFAFYKHDGTTATNLGNTAATYLVNNSLLTFRIDWQIISFGASCTMNLFVNGSLALSFSGDLSTLGISDLDGVALGFMTSNTCVYSEVIVATDDTRARVGLLTLAGSAGTTDNWTGTPSNVTGTTISDLNPVNSNTAAQDEQFALTDLPAGTFAVDAVKISMRAAVSSSPTATQIKMGYFNGVATTAFGTGSTKTPTTVYGTFEQLDLTNPITSTGWVSGDINALQLNFRSA